MPETRLDELVEKLHALEVLIIRSQLVYVAREELARIDKELQALKVRVNLLLGILGGSGVLTAGLLGLFK